MKNQSTEGAKHFSEIVAIARQLADLKAGVVDAESKRLEIIRLTEEFLTYQTNRPSVSLKIY